MEVLKNEMYQCSQLRLISRFFIVNFTFNYYFNLKYFSFLMIRLIIIMTHTFCMQQSFKIDIIITSGDFKCGRSVSEFGEPCFGWFDLVSIWWQPSTVKIFGIIKQFTLGLELKKIHTLSGKKVIQVQELYRASLNFGEL